MLATTWKERRLEISKLQKQHRFTDAKDLRRSFRVEVEELKRKTKCNRCGKIGHWARECRQKGDFQKTNPSGKETASGKGAGKESAAGVVTPLDVVNEDEEIHFIAAVDVFASGAAECKEVSWCHHQGMASWTLAAVRLSSGSQRSIDSIPYGSNGASLLPSSRTASTTSGLATDRWRPRRRLRTMHH